ncbi:MAG: cAMP/cGMP-dependent 3',5'-cyclic-AMP/GMP phosphodiesterase [Desulfobacterales bacterium]|nr:cAMP/cGMP-dependent 3',5'-cyclic-AMP/GMP phosphodiesterase [Desulfobacterales bacterium]
MTTLGAGHGFDPGAMTSGMIIWLNGRGIMVDPPVNSAIDLVGRGVNPKILDSIILTHCHADHDAGTLQKILQEGRITLYTTRTIFNSFLTKSTALTHIPSEVLEESVQFVPLCPGEETNIHGGLFRFHYSLHSIPTLFFEVAHGGKSMVYSSDTHNNPPYIEELFQQGVLDENRRNFLLNFPWDKDVIFHEAGLPPLHTPMEVLTVLPQEIRDRLFLVHVTREMIPAESGLKIAPTGLAATVTLDVPRRRFGPAAELLSVYLDNPQLRSLGPEKTMEFLLIAQAKTFQAGTRIYGTGDADPHCYMVMGGQVDIWVQGERLTTHSRSEIFGEEALFSQEPREREAVAHSDVQMIVLEKSQFRTFIHNTPLEESLRPLPSDRDRMLRTILAANPVLSQLTPSQQTQFIRLVQHRPHAAGEEILLQGEPIPGCFFIHEGEVAVTQGHWEDTTLTAGQVFGIHALIKNDHISAHEFSAATPCDLYFVATADLEDFLAENPGILLQFYHNTH